MLREGVVRDILRRMDLSRLPDGEVGVTVGNNDQSLNARIWPKGITLDGKIKFLRAHLERMSRGPWQGRVRAELPGNLSAEIGNDSRGWSASLFGKYRF